MQRDRGGVGQQEWHWALVIAGHQLRITVYKGEKSAGELRPGCWQSISSGLLPSLSLFSASLPFHRCTRIFKLWPQHLIRASLQIVLRQKTHLCVCDVVNHSQTSCLKSDLRWTHIIGIFNCIREDKTQEQILMRALFIAPLLSQSKVKVKCSAGFNGVSMKRDFTSARFRPATDWRTSDVHDTDSDEVKAAPRKGGWVTWLLCAWGVAVQVSFIHVKQWGLKPCWFPQSHSFKRFKRVKPVNLAQRH